MSFKHMKLIIEYSRSKTRGPDRAILLILAYRANDRGECWPSLSRIANDSGLSRGTVAFHLPQIQRTGEIIILSRGRKGKHCRSNLYKITLAEPDSVSPGAGLTGKADSPPHRPQIVREPDGSSSGSRTSVSPGAGLESSENSQSEPSMNRQGKKPVGPSGLYRINYEEVEPPEIMNYGDIHGCSDPILAAMAITGERSKRGWGHWVKILNHGRKEHGPERAGRLFRGCLTELYGEIKQGECNKPGAILNMKLKKVFGEQCEHWLNNERKPDHDEP